MNLRTVDLKPSSELVYSNPDDPYQVTIETLLQPAKQ